MNQTGKFAVVAGGIGVLLAGIGVFYYFVFSLPQSKTQELQTVQNQQAAANLVSEQQQCYQDSKTTYTQTQEGMAQVFGETNMIGGLTQHFNQKLNECIANTIFSPASGSGVGQNSLWDVYDNKQIAECTTGIPDAHCNNYASDTIGVSMGTIPQTDYNSLVNFYMND